MDCTIHNIGDRQGLIHPALVVFFVYTERILKFEERKIKRRRYFNASF